MDRGDKRYIEGQGDRKTGRLGAPGRRLPFEGGSVGTFLLPREFGRELRRFGLETQRR